MHHPLTRTYCKGVILRDSQIVHHLRPRHNLPAGYYSNIPIGPQDVHAQMQLSHWHKAFFQREEGMFLVGVNDLTRLRDDGAMGCMRGRGQGQVYRVVVESDTQDSNLRDFLILHLLNNICKLLHNLSHGFPF